MGVIIHVDELFLKGNNQSFFYKQLINNLKSFFKISFQRIEGAIWVENADESFPLDRLAAIPGIANVAVADSCANDLASINNKVIDFIKNEKTESYRIKCERADKSYPLTSVDIEKEVGRSVCENKKWAVNLNQPELTIFISILRQKALIYSRRLNGAGGLPTGVSGRVLCLLSGGLDSPVAAYQLMCRGAEIGLLHFQNLMPDKSAVENKIIDLTKQLNNYQPSIQLLISPFSEAQKQIIMNIPAKYRVLVARRFYMRAAEQIANQHNYHALATGDCLGQVASQTLENLTATYAVGNILKFSPLIGINKKDIISKAKAIGTFEISNRPYDDCCSMFLAKHPETRATQKKLIEFEKNLDFPALLAVTPVIRQFNFSAFQASQSSPS